MKHVFSVIGVCCALLFVVVFFTGRIDSKHLALVAPRVGMHADELGALAPRIASQTGATVGTSRRVVYLLACSGMPDRATMEGAGARSRGDQQGPQPDGARGGGAGALGQAAGRAGEPAQGLLSEA